ncbi:MAG: Endonuclease 4 [Chlamydiales bacterium]|nr:Endonuclease 4 [Chlamydiales bacterium]MCH9619383.1 Endonuclease 4 [Chlamydiales bacterium]MCH9622187.1 Endonuclease 4 [Chlamydiales bacterium]
MKTPADQLLIGAHTSAAGGAHNALLEGESIGATTIQLFTANQKQWKGKALTESGIELFRKTKEEIGLEEIMCHASYLINLGCPNADTLKKSRQAFREELQRCLDLEISYLNFHPGAALKDPVESCLDRIVDSLLNFEDLLLDDSTTLLLETTAGQGSCVGHRFEELAYIIEETKDVLPIGVCIDTCHIFAAGYDIRSAKAWNKTLEEFDKIVGLDYLYAFHLNDSLKEFASRRDRHAPLGEGEIGLDCFKFLMRDPRTRDLPKYLETPGGPPLWEKEIKMLREYAK